VDKVDLVDYKDVRRLRGFVSERGKIIPRRISGSCARHQRQLTTAIQRARTMALLPYVGE
jgi:small subunit ribosomal protein S18